MRPYTNASSHYIFAMKALGSHTDATEGPEINFQLANGLCLWMAYAFGFIMAMERLRNFFISQVLLIRALCKNGASLTIVVLLVGVYPPGYNSNV